MEKIKVKSEGYEEYWAPEHKCPFCRVIGIIKGDNFCAACGKSFENVEFEKDERDKENF